jgi:hypothetical protein
MSVVLTAVLMAGGSSHGAQNPPANAPSPAAASFTFPGGAGLIFWLVKPEEVESFELVWTVIRGRLAASPRPELQAMDASLTMYKEETVPGQDASYMFLAEPAPPTANYSVSPFLLYESGLFERPEADELFATLQKATVRVTPIALSAVKAAELPPEVSPDAPAPR